MRFAMCVLALFGSLMPASAEEYDEGSGLTALGLDIYQERTELEQNFPQLELGKTTTRNAIENYRQALERFRASELEGFALRIKRVCDEMNLLEAELNRRARANVIEQSEYRRKIDQIARERKNCDLKNYNSSLYWGAYDYFLNRYRRAVQEANDLHWDCMSQNACRQRRI